MIHDIITWEMKKKKIRLLKDSIANCVVEGSRTLEGKKTGKSVLGKMKRSNGEEFEEIVLNL
jgi:hypothetical protein